MKTYDFEDVIKHTSREDLWLSINGNVYDATSFVHEHPGGEEILIDHGGLDATEDFEEVEHSNAALEILSTLKIGTLKRQARDPAVRLPSTNNTSTSHAAKSTPMAQSARYASIALSGAFILSLLMYFYT